MLETLIATFAPHECLLCEDEGFLLCERCTTGLPALPERCYRCRAISPGGRTCRGCHGSSALYAVQVATEYTGPAKDLIWRLKFTHARAAVKPMAASIVQRTAFDSEAVLAYVPTATSRVRQRGYDQAALLCRELSRRSELPARRLLARHGQMRQVGAGRTERLRHLTDAFRARNLEMIRGKHVILVDDVLTTGATLECAAKCLRQAGAARVTAIVFAQA